MSKSSYVTFFNKYASQLDQPTVEVARVGLELLGFYTQFAFDAAQILNICAIIYANNVIQEKSKAIKRDLLVVSGNTMPDHLKLTDDEAIRAKYNVAKNLASALTLLVLSTTTPASVTTIVIYLLMRAVITMTCEQLYQQRNNPVLESASTFRKVLACLPTSFRPGSAGSVG